MNWSVDGIEWTLPCTIEREAEVTASDISGMMLDKSYFNDVLGTWMKYTVAIAVPIGKEGEYSALYDVLTNPVNYHTFVLPYNSEWISLTARVQVVSDAWLKLANGGSHWRKIKFDIIANNPSKEAVLSEIVEHGISPLPTAPTPTLGALYEWTETGWVEKEFADADENWY